MRGTVHIVGPAAAIERTFECDPPRPNPPKDTYYRRAVYMIALERLHDIRDAIKSHDTQHTGRAYRNERGDVVGRGKGILPSLEKQFREVRGWTKGPAALRKTIEDAKSPAYFTLLQAAVHQVEADQGEQLELFVKTSPRATLDDLPPVIYPAHKGSRKCKKCRRPHSAAVHRFHLKGSFIETHPGPARAAHRRADRAADRERWRDEIPF